MNIALIGASGFVGKAILAELLARKHTVTAITSRPERIAPAPTCTVPVRSPQAIRFATSTA